MVRVRFGLGFEVSNEDLKFRFDLHTEGQN